MGVMLHVNILKEMTGKKETEQYLATETLKMAVSNYSFQILAYLLGGDISNLFAYYPQVMINLSLKRNNTHITTIEEVHFSKYRTMVPVNPKPYCTEIAGGGWECGSDGRINQQNSFIVVKSICLACKSAQVQKAASMQLI